MSESKFTPGPWMLKKEYDSWSIRQKGSTKRHAGYETYTEVCEGVSIKRDAKLIAVAPELYQAAVLVLAGLNARIDEAANKGLPVPVFNGIADLHAAINKATA